MLRLSSVNGIVRSVGRARSIELYAYTLRPGPVLASVEEAARGGARVSVRLNGAPYGAAASALLRRNRRLVAELARCGADARLTASGDSGSLHAKVVIADGRLFLDDRNFGVCDFVVRDDASSDVGAFRRAAAGAAPARSNAGVAFDKPGALAREAALIAGASDPDGVVVETETFGWGEVDRALQTLAAQGGSPRLLASSRQARHTRERAALEKLARAGVRVRLTRDSEKFAVVADAAWIGSANASPAFGTPPAADWGAITRSRAIVAEARRRVEAAWSSGKPLRLR